jgi:hypothetical protein
MRRGSVTPAKVVLNGVMIVLLTPIAEEVFWRGYVLEQLRRFTRSRVALLIQSLLFAIVHTHTEHFSHVRGSDLEKCLRIVDCTFPKNGYAKRPS